MEKLTSSKRLNSLLYKMGIYSYKDVINHLPKRYDSFLLTKDTNLNDKDRVVLLGTIISVPKLNKGFKTEVVTFDFLNHNKHFFRIIAYNRPYLINTIKINEEYTIIGTYDKKRNEINLINLTKGRIEKEKAIRPIYQLPTDYSNHLFVNLVKKSLESEKGHIYSYIPYYYLNKYRLIDKESALNKIHNPSSYEDIKQALRFLKYEEALTFSLKNALIKEENRSLAKIKKEPIDLDICEPFLSSLPYTLTKDQEIAAREIIEDMNQSSLMYRMLQGDVGSGKTLVSFIALYANHLRGDQGAMMTPTDSLAKQHYENAKKIFANTKLKIALLVGSTKENEKRNIYDDLMDGSIDIVIGTHALFTKSVQYSSLGLVIIDEQHRFGVNQRIALANKGEHADLLMMSATPIPRSLGLTLYGDLDISTLTSFPSTKRDVTTEVVNSNDERIYQLIDESLKENRQVYIVAPLIDYRDDERYSVEQLYARFVLRYGNKVGLLHGKMSANDKEIALSKFYSNEVPILVTTPVIEVGIDVKPANLMIIYDASNFGLASLHQLRGRVGRDGSKAYCLLTHDDETDEEALTRLNILTKSNDGFEIAEEDLKNRGPGELMGLKQSGMPNFNYLNVIDDIKIFTVARDDAKYILNNPKEKGFEYFIERVKKDINKDPIIKG